MKEFVKYLTIGGLTISGLIGSYFVVNERVKLAKADNEKVSQRLLASEILTEEVEKNNRLFKLAPKWDLFEGSHSTEISPIFTGNNNYKPCLFNIASPKKTGLEIKFTNLALDFALKEAKRPFKRDLKRRYKSSNMSEEEYFKEKLLIGNLNYKLQEPHESDEQFSEEFRADIFKREYQGEVPLVSGPLRIWDSGRFSFNYKLLLGEEDLENIVIGDEAKKTQLVLNNWVLDTDFNISVSGKEILKLHPEMTIKKLGFSFMANYISDVLGKEMISIELETEIDPTNPKDYAAFFNVILKSRK